MISSIHVRGEILPMYPILFKYKAFDLVLQKERQPSVGNPRSMYKATRLVIMYKATSCNMEKLKPPN